ncbi:MAG: sulfur carrier protein ThiS [Candidatus Latescibacteria bacterium]|jgi:sulfur carrier protein|nr:sulfur carrier protein ThiS [Candidatus Latescibacterota bacterium]
MRIVLNGEDRDAKDGLTVHALLLEIGIDPAQKGVAVAVNGEIALRQEWATSPLQPDDRVDIIRAVQGG